MKKTEILKDFFFRGDEKKPTKTGKEFGKEWKKFPLVDVAYAQQMSLEIWFVYIDFSRCISCIQKMYYWIAVPKKIDAFSCKKMSSISKR